MKLLSSILITCIVLNCHSFALAQSQYEAKVIFKKDNNSTYQTSVLITMNSEVLRIDGKKDKNIQKYFAYSDIKKVDYSFSERPQVLEASGLVAFYAFAFLTLGPLGIIETLLLAELGIIFSFTTKKRHWIVLTAQDETTYLFELKKADYRQLIFDMSVRGINIEDLGKKKRK